MLVGLREEEITNCGSIQAMKHAALPLFPPCRRWEHWTQLPFPGAMSPSPRPGTYTGGLTKFDPTEISGCWCRPPGAE
jgi:hypothetical protein